MQAAIDRQKEKVLEDAPDHVGFACDEDTTSTDRFDEKRRRGYRGEVEDEGSQFHAPSLAMMG